MVGQDIQKHNPDSTDEGYDTRASTPTSRTHLEDDVLDTTLSSELHITEEDSEGSYSTEYNENIDESEGEDTLNVSYETCPVYGDMDEDALSVLYETCQSEQDIEDELEDLEVMGTFQPDIAIYKQVDECVRKNTLSTLLNTRCQTNTSNLYSNETVEEEIIKKSLELIAFREDKKSCLVCHVMCSLRIHH